MVVFFSFFNFCILFKDHAETKPITSIVADICDTEAIEEIFVGVDVVFHCAAFINFQFPPNMNELERVNVNGRPHFYLSTHSIYSILIFST